MNEQEISNTIYVLRALLATAYAIRRNTVPSQEPYVPAAYVEEMTLKRRIKALEEEAEKSKTAKKQTAKLQPV